MGVDVTDADLAAMAMPYVTAAIAVYGAAVMDRVRDAAVDATADAAAGLGRRLLRRFLPSGTSSTAVAAAVQDVAGDPDDADLAAALRSQLRKALRADPALAADIAAMLPAGTVAAVGPRSAAVRHNTGIVQTGDSSQAWQGNR